ncbi:hypothetical protein ABV409_03715 [Flagellimonas sp. DF-77]
MRNWIWQKATPDVDWERKFARRKTQFSFSATRAVPQLMAKKKEAPDQ